MFLFFKTGFEEGKLFEKIYFLRRNLKTKVKETSSLCDLAVP